MDKALAATAQRGGRLAVAIVCSVATPYSSADHAAVCSLVARFGAGVLKRSLLLFTGGDLLSADGAGLADYLADAPPDLQVRLLRFTLCKTNACVSSMSICKRISGSSEQCGGDGCEQQVRHQCLSLPLVGSQAH